VLLHNQIVKQTADLVSSTATGTPNPSLEIKRRDTLKVYEDLYQGKEKLFQVSLYVDSQAPSLHELDLLTEKCKANLNALLIVPKNLDYKMAAGVKSMLPIGVDAVGVQKEFLTSSLSATFPFMYPVNSRKRGLFFSHERRTLNPIFIDFDSMSNKHFFVLGISGSGKSYASKFLVLQHLLAQQSKVFILDPNGEYKELTRRLGGEVVELSKNSDSMINLFDLAGEDFGSKMLTLISVFDIITGGLTESQKGVLNEALLRVYGDKGIEGSNPATWGREPPTFSDLKRVLKKMMKRIKAAGYTVEEKSLEVLVNRVRMYSEKGFFGFLDRQTRVNLKNGFLDFDLSSLPSQVKQLVMFSVLELVSREIRKDHQPKVVLIDEGWSLLRSKEAENYVLEFIKTSRKNNASIGFITQEIEDLLRSEGGKSILNTTSTKILLRQNSSNLDLIRKTLALNGKGRDFLLQAGKGEGLLINEQGRFEFRITAPPKLHALITTDPNEQQETLSDDRMFSKETKIDVNLSKGFYIVNDVTAKQREALRKEGYVLHKSRLLPSGGSSYFLVKKQGKESAEHALLAWYIADEIQKRGGKPVVSATVNPDVFVTFKGKKYCFEVETGRHLSSHGSEFVRNKIEKLKNDFDAVVVVVTDRSQRGRYARITEVPTITRTQVPQIVNELIK